MFLTALLIAAVNQYRADREMSERQKRQRLQRHQTGVWIVPNFSPFSLSALSGRINSAQFHSLNSAFPGQSQAFTEFSPHTLNTPNPPHPPTRLSNHPFILYLRCCNFNRAVPNAARTACYCQPGRKQSGAERLAALRQHGDTAALILFPPPWIITIFSARSEMQQLAVAQKTPKLPP